MRLLRGHAYGQPEHSELSWAAPQAKGISVDEKRDGLLRGSESRANALWGRGGGGRRLLGAIAAVAALAFPATAAADSAQSAFVAAELRSAAEASPTATFEVIVQSDDAGPGKLESVIRHEQQRHGGTGTGVRKRLETISAVAADLTGAQLLALAEHPDVLAITRDAPVVTSSLAYSNLQKWPYVSGVARFWDSSFMFSVPAIAIVDSGVSARSDFGSRLVHHVDLAKRQGNSPGDGRGHGTFVASIAAGAAPNAAGAAPRAPIVSLDVIDDNGMAMTSAVIEAAGWILEHKDRFNIRVANFSVHTATPTSIRFDPLDRAVEALWLSGVVVVAAAGNYAQESRASGVPFAPANDPFVITVGAVDTRNTMGTGDDFVAPWSAYGYTPDGFAKPELGAPGRFMVGAVTPTSTLGRSVTGCGSIPGYIRMSGTSFAAPVVAGAAANLLAAHPNWTPDQVKGALMLTAKPLPATTPLSAGVGQVRAHAALGVVAPPNPNAALYRFVERSDGEPSFDAAAWAEAAASDPAWSSASWSSASWSSASWSSASWSSASWSSASWSSDSWTSASWTSATSNEIAGCGGYAISPDELAEAKSELGVTTAPVPPAPRAGGRDRDDDDDDDDDDRRDRRGDRDDDDDDQRDARRRSHRSGAVAGADAGTKSAPGKKQKTKRRKHDRDD
jgi:serine protease AprX